MEKPAEQQKTKQRQPEMAAKESILVAEKPLVWDCGSSLYDSFELESFEKQLRTAIHSRSLSMPHLSDRRVIHDSKQPSQPPPPEPTSKKSSKISRSIHRLLRSVFKPKQQQNASTSPPFFPGKEQPRDGFYVVYDYESSGMLSTIPEVPELDSLSPEMKSFVKRTASDRFLFTPPVGISCA